MQARNGAGDQMGANGQKLGTGSSMAPLAGPQRPNAAGAHFSPLEQESLRISQQEWEGPYESQANLLPQGSSQVYQLHRQPGCRPSAQSEQYSMHPFGPSNANPSSAGPYNSFNPQQQQPHTGTSDMGTHTGGPSSRRPHPPAQPPPPQPQSQRRSRTVSNPYETSNHVRSLPQAPRTDDAMWWTINHQLSAQREQMFYLREQITELRSFLERQFPPYSRPLSPLKSTISPFRLGGNSQLEQHTSYIPPFIKNEGTNPHQRKSHHRGKRSGVKNNRGKSGVEEEERSPPNINLEGLSDKRAEGSSTNKDKERGRD